MAGTGSLIQLHIHDNKAILDAFSENSDKQLLYRGKLIDAKISEKEKNLLTREEDGLYVDGSVLGEFTYDDINKLLKFKGVTVSQEYDKRSITLMIYDLWKEINSQVKLFRNSDYPYQINGSVDSFSGSSDDYICFGINNTEAAGYVCLCAFQLSNPIDFTGHKTLKFDYDTPYRHLNEGSFMLQISSSPNDWLGAGFLLKQRLMTTDATEIDISDVTGSGYLALVIRGDMNPAGSKLYLKGITMV